MSKQQTAVDWLIANMPNIGNYIPYGIALEITAKFQQAKAMERQQIIDAFKAGQLDIAEVLLEDFNKRHGTKHPMPPQDNDDAEKYYRQTFAQ